MNINGMYNVMVAECNKVNSNNSVYAKSDNVSEKIRTSTDIYEHNSYFKPDPVSVYEKLCSEFPGVNYILSDCDNPDQFFYNNINTKIGNGFGNINEKSIFIDIDVIEKICEDPSYYSKAKSEIKIVLDAYDEHQAEGAKDGRPYTTGYVTLEDGVITGSWSMMQDSFKELVNQEESRLNDMKKIGEMYYKGFEKVKDSLLDEFIEKVGETKPQK